MYNTILREIMQAGRQILVDESHKNKGDCHVKNKKSLLGFSRGHQLQTWLRATATARALLIKPQKHFNVSVWHKVYTFKLPFIVQFAAEIFSTILSPAINLFFMERPPHPVRCNMSGEIVALSTSEKRNQGVLIIAKGCSTRRKNGRHEKNL